MRLKNPGRYAHNTRVLQKHIKRVPLQKRRKRVHNPLTPAEQKVRSTARRAVKQSINQAIAAERAKIWQSAEDLFARFKKKTVRWWYSQILMAGRRRARRVSPWNGWILMKQKEQSAGTSS